jgi:hypothetical protein
MLLIYRQRSEDFLPPGRAFRLRGWIGWFVNIWVIVVISTTMVFFFLPPFLPATADTMSKFSHNPIHGFSGGKEKKRKEEEKKRKTNI